MYGDLLMELLPSNVTYMHFVEGFLSRNKPCLIDQALTASWRARQLWQEDGKPNLEYIRKEFGDTLVQVADCNDIHFSSHPKTTWSLSDYIDYWKQFNTSYHDDSQVPPTQHRKEKRLLYLKDWHFTRDYPSYCPYIVPELFSSDWLNEVYDQCGTGGAPGEKDDYRFVYMGPSGTWSYSWSVNVCGRKEWLIFPPGEEEHLCDKYGNLPIDVTSIEMQDSVLYPHASKARQPLHVVQEMGQAIFIPSGWYHQVKNMEDTISINHNWTNVFGIKHTWKYLTQELNMVEREIDHCRSMDEWAQQCQLILKSEAAMDFNDFYQFLYTIVRPRLEKLKGTRRLIESHGTTTLNKPTLFLTEMTSQSCRSDQLDQVSSRLESFHFLLKLLPEDIKSQVIHVITHRSPDDLIQSFILLVLELCTVEEILKDMTSRHCLTLCEGDVIDVRSETIKCLK